MRLLYRFLLPIIGILGVAVAIIGISSVQLENRKVVQMYEEQLDKNILVVDSSLTIYINEQFGLLRPIAENQRIEAFMSEYNLNDSLEVAYVRDRLTDVLTAVPTANNIHITPVSGYMEIDALGAAWGAPHDLTESIPLKYFSNRPKEREIITGPISAPVNGNPILALVTSIEADKEFVGFLTLPLNLNQVLDRIIYNVLEDEDITVLLVDSEGSIIGSRDPGLIYNESHSLRVTAPELFDTMVSEGTGCGDGLVSGKSHLVHYRYLPIMNSYILAYKPVDKRNALLAGNWHTGIYIGVSILLVCSGLVYYLLRRLTLPIEVLAGHSDAIAEGEYTRPVEPSLLNRKDEIGVLARSYQAMSQGIQATFKEQEVSLREIFAKNRQLEASEKDLKVRLEEINIQNDRIQYLANHDALTDLPNRRQLYTMLQQSLDAGDRGALVLMDLDNFKSMNDRMGHKFGDTILETIAVVLKGLVDDDAVIARFGGDEFVVMVARQEDAMNLIQQIRHSFSAQNAENSSAFDITFSMGIALYPQDSQDIHELLAFADLAMYEVKKHGKNSYRYFDANMRHKLMDKEGITRVLKAALSNNGFQMHYQPQVDVLTGEVIAFEALLRLKSGAYSPGEFIPVAESSGLIIAIGQWVTSEVIRQIGFWQELGDNVKPVSINFSATQLQDADYLDLLRRELAAHDVPPELLELEVTESIYIENAVTTSLFLNSVKGLGIRISIDDFGTGYSSLSYLTYMPISKLKLDRALLQKFLNIESLDVLNSIVSLAHDLDMDVVAEGIEEAASVQLLKTTGCDIIQGYCFSKPVKAQEVPELFTKIYSIDL